MEDDFRSRIWELFEDAAPNLCYIGRTRETLSRLLEESESEGDLAVMLDAEMQREENASLRTDLKILKGRLEAST
jgi:hypothetical protein